MKKIVDGNTACSNIAYMFSEVCSIYPITPSSTMASNADKLISENKINIFESKPIIYEMQSEAGAAGTMHGSLLTGSLTTTFTASQGLLLMLPNMYKIAGEMLPGVFHVAARSLATQSLSIFGDHQDIYAARTTGVCMLASTSVYDAQNLALVTHLSAIDGSLPFIHFFDGFRTSHEINTIKEINIDDVKKLVNFDNVNKFKNRVLNVGCNKQYGLAENEDIYFQHMESRNVDYLNMPDIVNENMQKVNKLMGTSYKPFNYYGSSNASYVVVAMGSVCDAIKEYISHDNTNSIGLIEVHLYRPFSVKYLLDVLPSSVKKIAVIDKTKEAGSIGEPLYLDVVAALKNKDIKVIGGRYGLSSKNVNLNDIDAIYNNLINESKDNFTVGIVDDVTNLSLDVLSKHYKEDSENIKIYGFGSDGMVSASKDILKLINKKDDKYVQGYFEYDSKKSGGVTISHLRVSDNLINRPYYSYKNKLLVTTKFNYLNQFEMIYDVEDNGILFINTNKSDEEINKELSINNKNYIKDKNITVYKLNAYKLAYENKLLGKISKIMELAIFHLLNKDYYNEIEESIKNTFINKGIEVVNNNINALKNVYDNIKEVDINLYDGKVLPLENNIYEKINNRKGYSLKVSDFNNIKDGFFPCGLSKNEKRCISDYAPVWDMSKCIECGKCSFVCPHGVIRPFVGDFKDGKPYMMDKSKNYKILISSEDCTGCGLCVSACPGINGEKALKLEEIKEESNVSDYFNNHVNECTLNKYTVKGSQFNKPRFEFSGACAGCGEASYIKLLTQLLGDGLVIANATGCSSIYGGSAPSTPYSIPWANSLFEDNAEFAFGMHLSFKQKRNRLKEVILSNINDSKYSELYNKLLDNFENHDITMGIKESIIKLGVPHYLTNYINDIPSRIVFAVGGDGWAYDIGYGGIDHIIHSNENIKILVLDTEVYSNTGGQASKSTKIGAIAEFANMGKNTNKKDLFKIATCAPNCYVASISLGASDMQTVKSFKEAIEHNGPSLIIAYSPCIEHGIKKGMINGLEEQKLLVEAGYTLLMRYNPLTKKLVVDSKEPNFDIYKDILKNEVRYNSLYLKNKEYAEELLSKQVEFAKERYNMYKKQESEN